MKILLDECVTRHLKPHLAEFEVFTVREMDWSGIKNGKLLTLCTTNSFDILLTIDKNLQYQQSVKQHRVSVVVLNSDSSNLTELLKFMPELKFRINGFEKSKVYVLDINR
ncbi:MAG TPA: hypothetical protein DHV26_11565 [Cytophagales bacterium]|nr:hypothetical protein [Cytophagales bacterium]